MQTFIHLRGAITLALAGLVGVLGLHAWPFPTDDPFLALIHARKPWLFDTFAYAYATLWFSTSLIGLSLLSTLTTIVVFRTRTRRPMGRLPPYPPPGSRPEPFLILGEQHHPTEPTRAEHPTWLTIPSRGLHTGVMILGAVGTGKTSACLYPYVDQLLAWRADSAEHKIGGLVLEVKGDFCAHVRAILERHGRGADYIELGLDSPYCYNPLHSDIDPYAHAYAIATLLNNLYGRGKEPFWQQAYTDLVKFLILLRKVVDGYTTLAEIYRYAIEESAIERDILRGEADFKAQAQRIRVAAEDFHVYLTDTGSDWTADADGAYTREVSADLIGSLDERRIPYAVVGKAPTLEWHDRRQKLEAVKRWYYGNWVRLEQRLRSSIVEGIVVFLSLFDDNPAVARAFCPPKSAYDPGHAGSQGAIALPPLDTLIESGKVLALNFPVAMNPGLARALGVMLKLDFQRTVLGRIQAIGATPDREWRDVLFVCDEYHSFATTGDTDPTGDERTFALSRQARLIPIVATQSISSLRSAVHGDESWRTLMQCFRTKIFLASADEFTTRTAADLCGRAERLKPSYQLTEAGQDARVSWFTGRAAAPRFTVSASKHYDFRLDYVFQPKIFSELRNAQAIVLPYDGTNPHPPTYCYLKPHYLNVQTSYFDHVANGVL